VNVRSVAKYIVKLRYVLATLLLIGFFLQPCRADESLWSGAEGKAALEAYDDQRYSEAAERMERLLARYPDDLKLNFYLGRIALWFDDAPKGLGYLEKAARLEADDAGIQNALGDAYGLTAQKSVLIAKLSWAKKSKLAYEKAVRTDPRNLIYRWSLLEFYQLAPKIAGGGIEKAYAQAVEMRNIDEVEGRAASAALHLSEHEVKEAFAALDFTGKTPAEECRREFYFGRCAALSGERLEQARELLKRCAEQAEKTDRLFRASIHFRLADILAKLGQPENSRAERNLARETFPDFRPDKLGLRY